MRCPPIEWDDMVALGVDPSASVRGGDGVVDVTPRPSKHVVRLLSLMASSPPPDSSTDRMGYLRHIRDAMILCTDWTQAADAPLTQEQRTAWTAYRQALRDLPETYAGTGPIPWPQEPK